MLAPLSVTTPAVVLSRPTAAVVPASMALTVPACRSKLLALVSVPLLMLPDVICTPATVLLKPPRLKPPPLTTRRLPPARLSATPNVSVPAATVVVPV